MSKTALITGASSGIGLEMARLFARDKVNLALVARNEAALKSIAEELSNMYGIQADIIVSDLSQANAPFELFEEVQRRGLRVGYLINNAGFGIYEEFLKTELSRELEMIQLHVATTTALTKLFAEDMARSGGGRIMNVASTAAFQPGPWMSVYYATKAYMLSYSEAANEALRETGVTVTCLCPGPTPTNFQVRAKNRKKGLLRHVKTSAEYVARAGYAAMHSGKPLIVPGVLNKFGVFAVRILPRRFVTRLSRLAAEKS
ncbi:MAG: SDR family oxidoreductase [Calditrichaeota bacterium]|nr:SDR family oxidoreductase [Calditrichota bacterium]MCB9369690.1 SDR family oxidoreductase [Calditrichota bacterium]